MFDVNEDSDDLKSLPDSKRARPALSLSSTRRRTATETPRSASAGRNSRPRTTSVPDCRPPSPSTAPDDTTTPFKGAQLFHDAMLNAGNRSELVVNEGGDHGYLMRIQPLFEECLAKSDAFLKSLSLLP
jgi:acetyl esterase